VLVRRPVQEPVPTEQRAAGSIEAHITRERIAVLKDTFQRCIRGVAQVQPHPDRRLRRISQTQPRPPRYLEVLIPHLLQCRLTARIDIHPRPSQQLRLCRSRVNGLCHEPIPQKNKEKKCRRFDVVFLISG